ncbi:hypothetical protein ACHQM5_022594 [Ranunculus cassubicifolius]
MEMQIQGVEKGENYHERKGTVWTATAHVITATIGSGVLALAWSVAQLGWIIGPIALFAFAAITYYTSSLLADCYRYPNPSDGTRNPTYISAVKSYLGPKNVLLCVVAQYVNLWGAMVSYTITSATSMREVIKHETNGNPVSGSVCMIMFGVISILLCLFPNLEEITWLSILAAAMSFGYSIISLCLCIAKWISHGNTRGSIMGVVSMQNANISSAVKTWQIFQALGNIAFAFSFAQVLIEIQDTLKSPPSENVTMRKASLYGISVTTVFYVAIGCIGYAAFGSGTPGNILTGFSKPFWLVDIANIFIIVHLVGAYQVFAQPIFAAVEKKIASMWPEATFFQAVYTVRVPFTKTKSIKLMPGSFVLRSSIIVLTTLISMLLPFFNAIMGWLGAAAFFPLTVYLPISMYLSQRKIKRGAPKWFFLHGLCFGCLVVCFAALIGSTVGIIDSLKHAKLFHI